MRYRRHALNCLSYALAATCAFSVPAFADNSEASAGPAAEPAAPAGSIVLLEVTVTAQRYAEPLSKLGQTVEAVTANDLKTFDFQSTQDLAHLVPSFQATTSGLGGTPIYSIRGVNFATSNVGSTAPVGIYVDEVAYPYPLMSLGETFDLERVEVLDGPQGTLYGRNTTGGLVDYVAAKPTNTFEASVSAGVGNYSSWDSTGYVSGPLSDSLKVRLAYDTANRNDGWQQSVTRPNDTLGVLHRDALRGILEWSPTSQLNVELTPSWWERTGDTQAAQAMGFIVPNQTPAALASVETHPTPTSADWVPSSDQPQSNLTGIIRPADTANDHFYSLVGKISYRLNDELNLTSLTNYLHLNSYNCDDDAGVQTEQVVQCTSASIHTISEEARLIGDYKVARFTVGGYYAHDDVAEIVRGYAGELGTILGLRAFGLTLPSTYTAEEIDTSYRLYGQFGYTVDTVKAGFANVAMPFANRFKLTLGGRFTQDDVDFTGAAQDQNGNNVALVNTVFPVLVGNPNLSPAVPNGSMTLNLTDTGFTVAQESQDQSNFAFRVNLDWTPTQNSLFYALIARGYKAGLFPTLAASTVKQLTPVSQEELTDYEIGAKLSLADDRLKVNGALFYYDYDNRQVYGQIADLIFGTLPRIVNIPKSEMYGFNGDLTWRVTSSTIAHVGAAYLESRINDYTGYNELGQIVSFNGQVVPFAPKFQGFAAIVQQVPVGPTLGLDIAVNGSYQSLSYGYIGQLPQFAIDPYALFDGSLVLHDAQRNWLVTAYVHNMLDKYYWTTTELSHDSYVRFAGMPRTYGLRVTYNFE